MKVALIVPFRPNPERPDTVHRVVAHYEPHVDEVVLADDPGEHFNRGRALNHGVELTDADLFVFGDADLLPPLRSFGWALDDARGHVYSSAAYFVPFDRLISLTPLATSRVIEGFSCPPDAWPDGAIDYRWERPSTGGCNIVYRSTFEAVGGFDSRFSGWGFEDAAWDLACSTLVGRCVRYTGQAVHLWHPTDPSRSTRRYEENRALCLRYEAAADHPEAMRSLIGER